MAPARRAVPDEPSGQTAFVVREFPKWRDARMGGTGSRTGSGQDGPPGCRPCPTPYGRSSRPPGGGDHGALRRLPGKAVAADGLRAYRGEYPQLRRCRGRPLDKGEVVAAGGGAGDETRHDRLRECRCKILRVNTLAPLTVMHLTGGIRGIVPAYPDGKPRTRPANAIPHMLAFFECRGMRPRNSTAGPACRLTPKPKPRLATATAPRSHAQITMGVSPRTGRQVTFILIRRAVRPLIRFKEGPLKENMKEAMKRAEKIPVWRKNLILGRDPERYMPEHLKGRGPYWTWEYDEESSPLAPEKSPPE